MPIVIRGTGYEREWYSNMSIGENGEHEGFSSAADTVYAGVLKFVEEHKSEWGNKEVKYWIVGYSRAAGVANLTGRRVVDGLHDGTLPSGDAFTYTFGTPKGGRQDYVDKATAAGYDYNSIHNIVNAADVIVVFAPSDMGFIRYGLDHYVPGTDETDQRNSDSKSWTFNGSTITPASTIYDNTIWTMNSKEYEAQKKLMLEQLAAIDYCEEGETCVYQEFLEADKKGFVAAKFNIFNVLSGGSYLQEFKNQKGYEDSELTLEQFLVIFVRYIEAFGLYNDESQPSSTDSLRYLMASYQTDVSSLSPDEGLEVFAGYLKGMTDEESKIFSNCFTGLASRFEVSELFTFYINYLAYYWPYQSAESRKAHLQTLWEKFVTYKVAYTDGNSYSILQVFTGSDQEDTALGIELKESFFVMFDLLLRFIAVDNMTYTGTGESENRSDYNGDTYYRDASGKVYHVNFVENVADGEFTQDKYGISCLIMLGTLLRNSSFLPLNHHPELTFAWVRSYDAYYTNDTGKDKMVPTVKYDGDLTITPTVSGDSCGYSGSGNDYYGDCTLTLKSNKTGTVLLYRVNEDDSKDTDNHYNTYKFYRGPIELNYKGTYKVDIKAYYMGKTFENSTTYNIIDAPVSINGTDVTSQVYDGSAVAYLGAYYSMDPSLYQFIQWNSYNAKDGSEIIISDDLKNLLSLPIEAKATYARDYKATYVGKITNVVVNYEESSSTPTITLTQHDSESTLSPSSYNISYRLDGQDEVEEGEEGYTYVSTVVTLYEDSANSIYYSSAIGGTINNPNQSGEATSETTTVTYNSTDGSVTLERQYKYPTKSITENFYKVTVNYYDENNLDATIAEEETYVMANELPISISAKEFENEKFSAWYDESGAQIGSDNKITLSSSTNIKAYYRPTVTSVSGKISELVVDGNFPTEISEGTAIIKGESYPITGSITWEKYTSEGWVANTDTTVQESTGYRATITPSFDGSGIKYSIGENLIATVNGKTLSNVDIEYDGEKPILKFIMASNKKTEDDKSLVQVYDNSISSLTRSQNSKAAIQEALANTTVKVLLADGSTVDANVNWNDFTFKSSVDDQIVVIEGNVIGVENPNGVSTKVTQKFIIPGLKAMSEPIASNGSGSYNYSVSVTLSSPDGGTIYYTKDGSDPTDVNNEARKEYNGETITFKYTGEVGQTGAIKPQQIRAYVKGDGTNTKDSTIVTFIYTITNNKDDSAPTHKSCEDAIGPNWTWSEAKNACVYKVRNTSSIR